jgi:prophage regulatory protein
LFPIVSGLVIWSHSFSEAINMTTNPLERVLRWPEVRDRTGLSRSTVWRWVRAGSFPVALPLGPQSVGWLAKEVDAWIAARVALRDQTTADK